MDKPHILISEVGEYERDVATVRFNGADRAYEVFFRDLQTQDNPTGSGETLRCVRFNYLEWHSSLGLMRAKMRHHYKIYALLDSYGRVVAKFAPECKYSLAGRWHRTKCLLYGEVGETFVGEIVASVAAISSLRYTDTYYYIPMKWGYQSRCPKCDKEHALFPSFSGCVADTNSGPPPKYMP
jgi:hypothetical protein